MNSSKPCLFPLWTTRVHAVSMQRELVGQEEPPQTKPGQKSQDSGHSRSVGVLVSEGRKHGGLPLG